MVIEARHALVDIQGRRVLGAQRTDHTTGVAESPVSGLTPLLLHQQPPHTLTCHAPHINYKSLMCMCRPT
jgi:hypothetical protein